MKFLTPLQFAQKHGKSRNRVSQMLRAGRVKGAQRLDNGVWIIPSTSRWPGLSGPGKRLRKASK